MTPTQIMRMSSLLCAADEKLWFDTLSKLGNSFGFDYTLFAVLPMRNMHFKNALRYSNYPSPWVKAYDKLNFARIDPTIKHCVTQISPLVWSASSFIGNDQQRLYEKASTYGIRTGIALPIHGPQQETGILCFASDTQPTRLCHTHLEQHLPQLTLLRDTAFDTSRRFLNRHIATFLPKLTSRENECLKWIVFGKSTWEIAKIIGRTTPTIDFHIKNIYKKLGVHSRSAAVAKAIQIGLVNAN